MKDLFLPPNHVYLGDLRAYSTPLGVMPSVTTITGNSKTDKQKESLKKWREGKSEKELNFYTDRGTAFHLAIENYLKKEPYSVTEDIQEFFECIEPHLWEIDQLIAAEAAIYHPRLRYAGTFDALVKIGDEYILCDWKTSQRYKKREWVSDYLMQLSAYTAAINNLYSAYGIVVRKARVYIAYPHATAKRPSIYEITGQELLDWWSKFQGCCEQYWNEHGNLFKEVA